MAAVVETPQIKTLADLLDRLGHVPLHRVRFRPFPGTGTVKDVVHIGAHEDRLCELVDGVLVEKPMGLRESVIAVAIAAALRGFVMPRKLGIVTGEAGMMQIFPGLVRIPDVAFAAWERFPGRRMPREPVPLISPSLAVEVLSTSNTPAEMRRKRQEYFDSGVSLVWIVDLEDRTVQVFTSAKRSRTLTEEDTLDGGEVLPGFTLSLRVLFAELESLPAD